MKIGKTKHSDGGHIKLTKYINGVPAMLIVNNQGAVEMRATVNLDLKPDEGCVFIKDYAENEGVLKALEDAGAIELTGRVYRSGFVDIPEAKLLITQEQVND